MLIKDETAVSVAGVTFVAAGWLGLKERFVAVEPNLASPAIERVSNMAEHCGLVIDFF